MKKILQALNFFNSTLCVSASLRDELFRLSKGDKLSLRLLKESKPLISQMVHYSSRFDTGSHPAVEKSTRTDENGILTIGIDQVGRL